MDREKILSRLQDRLYDELEGYTNAEIKNGTCLETIDKLTHSIKSISTVLAMEGYDQERSGARRWNGNSRMNYPYWNRGSNGDYEVGRSRGSDDEYMRTLMELRNMAPDEHSAQAIQRMIDERR